MTAVIEQLAFRLRGSVRSLVAGVRHAQVDLYSRKLALLSEGRLADALAEAIPSKLTAGKGADASDADGDGGGASSAKEPSLEQQKGAPPANGTLAQACAVPLGRMRLSGLMFACVCRALALPSRQTVVPCMHGRYLAPCRPSQHMFTPLCISHMQVVRGMRSCRAAGSQAGRAG